MHEKKSRQLSAAGSSYQDFVFLHHAAHATHAWGCCGCGCLLAFLGDNALGGEEHAGNRCGILKGHTCHLGGINHACLKEILIAVGASVVTEVTTTLFHLVHHYGALKTSVVDNLSQRLFDSALHDVDACVLVGILALEFVEGFDATNIGHTATRDNTFGHSGTSCAQGVVHAVLLLLHFHLTVSTDV